MTLGQVRSLALSFPGSVEAPHFEMTSFRVRGRIFATARLDADYLHIFVSDEVRETARMAEPDFLEDLFWGKKAVGLRVLLAGAKPETIGKLLTQAWTRKAPKNLRPF